MVKPRIAVKKVNQQLESERLRLSETKSKVLMVGRRKLKLLDLDILGKQTTTKEYIKLEVVYSVLLSKICSPCVT